eukprot:scaffold5507_cov158-Isochrysis_galbana.AAC.1
MRDTYEHPIGSQKRRGLDKETKSSLPADVSSRGNSIACMYGAEAVWAVWAVWRHGGVTRRTGGAHSHYHALITMVLTPTRARWLPMLIVLVARHKQSVWVGPLCLHVHKCAQVAGGSRSDLRGMNRLPAMRTHCADAIAHGPFSRKMVTARRACRQHPHTMSARPLRQLSALHAESED